MKINTEKFTRLMVENFYNNDKLAKACGVAPVTISRIKTGKQEPHTETLRKLCEALKCSPADILQD